MADREKVIKGLEEAETMLIQAVDRGGEMAVMGAFKCYNHVSDALELLKEQEAKPMTEYDDGWDCPRCGLKLVGKTASGYPCAEFDLPIDEIVKYCPVCGQEVKWE